MKFLSLFSAAIALLATGAQAGDECSPIYKTVTVYVTKVMTETATKSVSYCPPPPPPMTSTYVTPCPVCPVQTITVSSQYILASVTTTYKPTSTACPVGTCSYGTTYVYCPTPTTVYYSEICPTSYYCPYSVYILPTKVYDVYCYEGTQVTTYRQESYCPTTTTVTTTKYIPEPTIFIYNDITINITIAPTIITYASTTTVTSVTTDTVTFTPPPPPPPASTGSWNKRALRY